MRKTLFALAMAFLLLSTGMYAHQQSVHAESQALSVSITRCDEDTGSGALTCMDVFAFSRFNNPGTSYSYLYASFWKEMADPNYPFYFKRVGWEVSGDLEAGEFSGTAKLSKDKPLELEAALNTDINRMVAEDRAKVEYCINYYDCSNVADLNTLPGTIIDLAFAASKKGEFRTARIASAQSEELADNTGGKHKVRNWLMDSTNPEASGQAFGQHISTFRDGYPYTDIYWSASNASYPALNLEAPFSVSFPAISTSTIPGGPGGGGRLASSAASNNFPPDGANLRDWLLERQRSRLAGLREQK